LVTAFYAVFDSASGRLHYTLAGHVPPLIVGPDETVSLLPGEGMLLGLNPRCVTRHTNVRSRRGTG